MNAKLSLFTPRGLFDAGTIIGLYRTLREYRDLNGYGRLGAVRAAIMIDWYAWRRSRQARREADGA